MALGTPTDGGAAYSAQNGTSVAPAYPAGIASGDCLVLIVGQKPSTANGGTVTTPTGWTLRESITGQGGYGATLAADQGNTNLFFYTKNTVDGTETGNLTVTVGTNNVSWGIIVLIPSGAGNFLYGTADGSRTTAPTSGTAFTTLLTNGATAPDIENGDRALWAMCIPTDILNNGFTVPTISSTGTTFGTAVELEEPDSGTGNDIGGYVAYAAATAGSSTAAPTVGVTATGTVTNVRGPIALIRIREVAAQDLTPDLYTNTPAFFTATLAAGAVDLSPALFTNSPEFFSADITQSGGAQTLTPSLFTNTPQFFTATLAASNTLTAALYTNTPQFFTPTVGRGAVNLSPALYTNTPQFFTATLGRGAVNLSPALYTNTPQFFTATLAASNTLTPALFTNNNVFFTATLAAGAVNLSPALYTNSPEFFTATLTQAGGAQTLNPALFTNTPQFFTATLTTSSTLDPALFTNNNVFFTATLAQTPQVLVSWFEIEAVTSTNLAPNLFTNTPQFFTATVTPEAINLSPALFTNTPQFFTATIGRGAVNLSPALFVNTPLFLPATLVSVGPTQNLTAALFTNTPQFFAASLSRELIPALFTNTPAFFTATIAATYPLTQASRFTNTPQFYGGTLVAEQQITFEDYVQVGYVDPGYVTYIADFSNIFFIGNLELSFAVTGLQATGFTGTVSTDLASVVAPTGVQATSGVGYVNIWGLINDAQDAGWVAINDTQAVNWTPVSGAQTANWQPINVTQDGAWEDADSCTC